MGRFNKLLFLFLSFVLISGSAISQQLFPSKWKFSAEQTSATEATLVFKVTLDAGWHIYSQFTPDGGPLPAAFIFNKNKCYELIGKVTEPKPHEEFDETFGVKVLLFSDEVIFKQKIKLTDANACKVEGKIEYQVCKDACIFKDTTFSIALNGGKGPTGGKEENNVKSKPDSSSLKMTIDTMPAMGMTPVKVDTSQATIGQGLEMGCGDTDQHADVSSLWSTFWKGFFGGLAAVIQPCVFSILPLTVSFFTKKNQSRKKGIRDAWIYGLSIIVIFDLLGIVVTLLTGNPETLNVIASNGYFNFAFFLIFLLFALSFFGAFEITLPSSWINKADKASDRGGALGIFFMAFTLCLVSFTCTVPIIGTLLVDILRGEGAFKPVVGMTGFGIALALPFMLFAMFPAWLKTLPKSGGWMNVVKVSLGFLELAFALKFLSNVDLAYHWGILKREIFISIWIIIFGLWGAYLLGKIRFEADDHKHHISLGRLLPGILSLAFTLYLVPGLWGAPLQLISGFPPPEFYKEWKTTNTDCPYDITCFHDYDEGMAYARLQNKPVMIDFTGWTCVNCRRMEDNVWSKPEIMKLLKEKYVLISLYVDDKTALPDNKQYITAEGKKITTVGGKWSDLQARKYNTNSQPWYVLLDHEEQLLNNSRGYSNVEDYKKFLDCGLKQFTQRLANK